jgi:hypothetical protein
MLSSSSLMTLREEPLTGFDGDFRGLASASALVRRRALGGLAAELRAREGQRHLLHSAQAKLQAALSEALSARPSDLRNGGHWMVRSAELLQPLLAGLAWNDSVDCAVRDQARSPLLGQLASRADQQPFTVLDDLERAIRQLFDRIEVQTWMALVAGIPSSALRSFVLHKLFAAMPAINRANVVRMLAETGHRRWSQRVAWTVEWSGEVEDYRIEVWPPVAEWVVASLAAGQVAQLAPSQAEELPEEYEESDESNLASAPFFWDLGRAGLQTLLRVRGMGQPSTARFLPHGFISSPLGRVLRSSGLVVLAQVRARHVRCPDCGHGHTFLTELGCGLACCHAVDPDEIETPWLVSLSAVGRLNLVEEAESEKTEPGKVCAAEALVREFFEPERGKALYMVRTRRIAAEQVAHEPLATLRKQVQAPVYRLMVMAALAGVSPVVLVEASPTLDTGWESRFLGNLERHSGGGGSFALANGARRSLCAALHVPEVPPLRLPNFKVIKNRIKRGFLEFLEARNPEVQT